MGRQPEGWTIKPDPRTGNQIVRFRFERRRYKLSTRTKDLGRATEEATRLYAEVVSGRRGPTGIARACSTLEIEIPAAKWLKEIGATLDKTTCRTYFLYVRGLWAPFFRTLDRVTEDSARDYTIARLHKVVRSTVVKELAALRGFLSWCKERGKFLEVVPPIESPSKRTMGTRRRPKREPVVLTEAEQRKVIAKLPEWCEAKRKNGRFPVRARFEFAWETALRPATIDELRTPLDWRPGRRTLQIRDEIDKARFGRSLPLTDRAIAALGRAALKEGIVFGAHDYRGALRAAALRARLPADKAARLSPYDFRHSRLTALGATTTNLVGLQYLAGHKHASTTARYLHAGARAAEEVLLSGHRIGSRHRSRAGSKGGKHKK